MNCEIVSIYKLDFQCFEIKYFTSHFALRTFSIVSLPTLLH